MARYIVKVGRLLRGGVPTWGSPRNRPMANVEAASPEDAAAAVVEDMGGDRTRLQESDPIDGMPVYIYNGTHALAVQQLTPRS